MLVSAVSTVVTTVASGTKTIMQVLAGTNAPLKLATARIGFLGNVVTEKGVRVQLVRQTTTASAGGSAVSLKKLTDNAETPQGSGYASPGSEPSLGDILEEWIVHPQSRESMVLPLSREYDVPGGGRVALRCIETEAVTHDCVACMVFQGCGA